MIMWSRKVIYKGPKRADGPPQVLYNVDTTKVNQKSMTLTLTLILNTNYECPKAYFRSLQLFDIKLMEKH